MKIIATFPVASIDARTSGVIVDAMDLSADGRHYNVGVMDNEDATYTIRADAAMFEVFFEREYDPQVVNQFEDKHVKTSGRWFFGLFGGERYVKGWAELKKKKSITYTTKNITIKQ